VSRAKREPANIREKASMPPRPLASGTPNPPLVLIVEDEEPIAQALSFIVEDAGYTPQTAADGVQAIALAHQRWPALVITDLMMPHMDGIALLAALRAEAAASGRPVPPAIVMTAASLRKAYEAGADAVLSKPFDLTDVEELLGRFLRNQPQEAGRP